MSGDRPRSIAQPPLEETAARIGPPAEGAGGVQAVVQTMRHAARHMGVRRALALIDTNQTRGFDCPGCAWPEPHDHRPAVEFCENGAKAVASEATKRTIGAEFFRAFSVAELGERSDRWLNDQGRIAAPMIRRRGATHYEPIAWEDAIARIAEHLRATGSPDRAAFYTSGRTSNEAAFLYQLFVRRYGTNNLPDCSNMCHESSGAAMDEALGVGKATVTLEDFALADAVFVVGQNPGTNHPRMLTTLREARQRGCTIVAVNPMDEAGTRKFAHPQDPVDLLGGGVPLASLWLPVRINGDVALFQGIAKSVLEREDAAPGQVLDHGFIADHTDGFALFAAHVRATSWEAIERGSGVSRELIERAAQVFVDAERTIVCWAMGITQHKNGVANVLEIINLLLLRGNIGRPGAGACPVRGHSNVQGDRTMGIWEKMPDAFLDRLGQEFGFDPPRAHGKDAVETIHAMRAGAIDVFFALGGNFLSAAPDTERTAEGSRAASSRCTSRRSSTAGTLRPERRASSSRASVAPRSIARRAARSSSRSKIRCAWSARREGTCRRCPPICGARSPSSPRSPRPRSAARTGAPASTGRPWPRTTIASASASRASCPGSKTSPRARGSRVASTWATPRASGSSARLGRRRGSPSTRSPSTISPADDS